MLSTNSLFKRKGKNKKQYQRTNCYGWGSNQDDRLGLLQQLPLEYHSNTKPDDEVKKQKDLHRISKPVPNYYFFPLYVHQVACGYRHTLFLLENGTVMACGWRKHGQCGNYDHGYIENRKSNSRDRNKISKIIFPHDEHTRIKMIGAGYASSFAVTQRGLLYSWGSNKFSCLGYFNNFSNDNIKRNMKSIENDRKEEKNDYQAEPRCVSSLVNNTVVSIACSHHHCIVLMENGDCMGWGRNNNSQLGLGIQYEAVRVVSEPKKIAFPTYVARVKSITCGPLHTLALCDVYSSQSLSSLSAPENKKIIESNEELPLETELFGWGSTDDYRLGHVLPKKVQSEPVSIPYFKTDQIEKNRIDTVIQVKAGLSHSLALDSSGHIHTWGMGTYGALGIGQVWESPEPMIIPGIQNVREIEAGYRSSFAIVGSEVRDGKGELFSWGTNSMGELALEDYKVRIQPHKVTSLVYSDCIKITSGHSHCVCLTAGMGSKVKELRHYRKYFELLEEGGPLLFNTLQNDMRLKGLNSSFLEEPNLILSDQNEISKSTINKNTGSVESAQLNTIPDEISCMQYCFDTIPNPRTNIEICKLRGTYETIFSCSLCKIKRICMVCARKCHVNHFLNPSLVSTTSIEQETKTVICHGDNEIAKKFDETANKCQCCKNQECNARWTPMRGEFDKMADEKDATIAQSEIPLLLERIKDDIEQRTGGLLLTKNRMEQALKSVGEALCELNEDEDIYGAESTKTRRVLFREFESWYINFFKSEDDE